MVTGVGGGTVRDLLIGAPVFWMQASHPVAICLGVAVAVWLTPQRWWSDKALDWFDAIGLAAYAVYGAGKALAFGIPPLPAAMMGGVTGCMGGIIRDVLGGEVPLILRKEIYVTAALLGSATFVTALHIGLPRSAALVTGFLACFALRAFALRLGWSLPPYRARPARDAERL